MHMITQKGSYEIPTGIFDKFYPLTCRTGKFAGLNFGHFMPKSVNFQGSGSAFFSACVQIAIPRNFSPIFIPGFAKTDFVAFSIPLTVKGFLTLSGIIIGEKQKSASVLN